MQQRIERFGIARTKDEREELSYMAKTMEKLSVELGELSSSFRAVKQSFAMILQDRFKTVELEIERGLEQDKKAREDKLLKRKIEFERERKADLLKRANETAEKVSSVSDSYKTVDAEEQELYSTAEELGVDTSKIQSVDSEIIAKFEELKRKVQDIKDEIASIEISDELTKEDLHVKGELNQKLNGLFAKLEIINDIMKECEKTIHSTKQNNRDMLSRGVAAKLGEDITSKVRADLLLEEEQLLVKKDTLWDKLTGKAKVKAAQIENLRLRRQYIDKCGLNIPTSMQEMPVYIAKYKDVLGEDKLPETLRKVVTASKTDVVVSDEEREMLEIARTGSDLIPLGGSKKQILSTLQGKNMALQARIQSEPVASKGNTIDNLEVKIKNSVERCLDTALFYTADLTEEQKKQIMQDRITL